MAEKTSFLKRLLEVLPLSREFIPTEGEKEAALKRQTVGQRFEVPTEEQEAEKAGRFKQEFQKLQQQFLKSPTQEYLRTPGVPKNITPEEIIHLMYVGHNNGPGVMLYALDHGGCKLSEQPAAVAAYSTDFKAGDKQREDYAKDVPPEYAIQKWRKGDEVVAELKKDGVTDLYPPDGMNDDTCPRLTGIRALAP